MGIGTYWLGTAMFLVYLASVITDFLGITHAGALEKLYLPILGIGFMVQGIGIGVFVRSAEAEKKEPETTSTL